MYQLYYKCTPGIVSTLSLIVCLRPAFGPGIGQRLDSQCIVTDAGSNVCTLPVTRLASLELSTPGGAKTRRSQREGALPGDNPIYDGGDSTISLAGIPWNALTTHYENLPSSEPRGRSFSNREFDNPIYGRNGTGTEESLYAYPDDPQLGVGQSVSPYHEFDNPIYGREGVENTYSEVHEPAVANGVATTTTTESIRTCSDHDYDNPC